MRKALMCVLLAGALMLTACSSAKQVYDTSSVQSADSGSAESAGASQTAKLHLETAKLTEDENRFLSLTADGNVLLYDYTAGEAEVSVELTCYELDGAQLKVLNRIAVPAGEEGRIAVTYDRMAEGFRLAVETAEGVKNMKLENPGQKLPDGAAYVGSYGSIDENYTYGQEIPLASEAVNLKDRAQTIPAQELWEHPENYADTGYDGIYLLTLSITPKQR